MIKNTLINLSIALSIILIIGLSSFLAYQFFKIKQGILTPNKETSITNSVKTPTPAPEHWLFYATVDNIENSQVNLKIIEPPTQTKSQTTISQTKITKPVTYSGAINNISIPTQHFQKQPSVSDTLQVFGISDEEGISTQITKIDLLK